MLSSRPYLARALYEWLLDNDQTPYIVVDAEREGVLVPRQFVQNGQIVLNLSPSAVRELSIGNDAITFNARFGGHPMEVVVPSDALIALYARENGVGMVFGHEPVMPGQDEPEEESEPVISDEAEKKPDLSSVESSATDAEDEGKSKAPNKGKPSLRVVK
ncbi:ClpXP protease specificity-enhancing factor [Aidingimonas halophila]|uniref:Stringent starvation protein B n=1 Tax=Aidingimonas halophila TaxID=574349 RepID=A0A1H2QUD5_9GAMM|nr:ClpXP protease specificity-enhancing factor [Aidingimonas halophila]GHC20233.1 stringent starvation protein B [Aidingimonas halophila]SDW10773.1 stringent starvation protein B [Aidingimonas halophila]